MKNSTLALCFGGLALVFVVSATAQDWGRPREPSSGVCFYEHANFEGEYFCARAGSSESQVPRAANDRISSIRVFGNARVVVYSDSDFRGSSRRFDNDARDLRHEGFNDRISSFRVEARGGNAGGNWGGGDWDSSWGRPRPPSAGACFYQDAHYRGDYFCAPLGASASQVPSGTNDRISSIRVYGGAEVTVFQDAYFEGRSSRFDSNMDDLRRTGWNDLISSFRVRHGSGGDRRNDGGYGSSSRDSGHSGRASSRMTREQAQAMVDRAYRSVLERGPDAGASGWVDQVMKNDWSQQQLEAELRKSPEYRSKHGR
jgi:hypothetical protein